MGRRFSKRWARKKSHGFLQSKGRDWEDKAKRGNSTVDQRKGEEKEKQKRREKMGN